MKNGASGPCLSAVFVDYDNIYLSLKRKNEEVAKRFAKDALHWLREIESGRLITPNNGPAPELDRRLVMNRCYGNPVPRRNSRDNSTDMSSFPFIRHHFLRAGFEIVDCPPLTAQLKNSSDIRMVMDIRDFLTHDTYFDEFVILSGDADFTPVLHRLRAHARRTVIYANEFTATPYTAICDGEIREEALIALLMDGAVPEITTQAPMIPAMPSINEREAQRSEIMAEVIEQIRQADSAVPIETLADRAQRALGHEKTIGTAWGGHGAFRTFLLENLPEEISLTDQPPYLAFEPGRHDDPAADTGKTETAATFGSTAPVPTAPKAVVVPASPVSPTHFEPSKSAPAVEPSSAPAPSPSYGSERDRPQPAAQERTSFGDAPSAKVSRPMFDAKASIARIHDACQAPPLAPPQYKALFEVLAAEIKANGLSGAQTITNIASRAEEDGLTVRRDDIRFVLDVVSEADPWFEQGASATLFAGRFRNFVVARCRGQGLNLSASEIDLINVWFAGGSSDALSANVRPAEPQRPAASPDTPPASAREDEADRWWSSEERRQKSGTGAAATGTDGYSTSSQYTDDVTSADFGQLPRIVRSQMGN